jgi:hypothetical protein
MRAQEKQAERQRLREAAREGVPWKKWGPYLSERQWGSVRENIDKNIEAWNDVTHDQARSRAYLSGEDGIAGWCDDKMLLCFALGLWNGKDPLLKERLFGLTNSEGNHGEDVKEYYFYLDSTPTHAYASMLYKYPQAAFPYENLVAENRRRTREDFEYELMDTGVFDENRYWDVQVDFAKVDPEDVLIRITATNRGPEPAVLHLVPQLWFRNTWFGDADAPRPSLEAGHHNRCAVVAARHEKLGERYLYCEGAGELLFTDNETNFYRLWGQANPTEYQKDGINDHIVSGRQNAVNPARKGTKSAFHARASRSDRARARRCGCASPRARRVSSPIRSASSTRRSPIASGRQTSSTATCCRRRSAPTPPASSDRDTRACCGRSRPTSTTSSAG